MPNHRDAGQPGPVRAALKSIAKEKSTFVKLKAEADKHMDGVPDQLYAVEGARSTVDTYHDKYDYLLQCAGKEPLDHPKNTDPNLYADTETLCDNATIDLQRIEAVVVEVELMCGECEEELVNRAVKRPIPLRPASDTLQWQPNKHPSVWLSRTSPTLKTIAPLSTSLLHLSRTAQVSYCQQQKRVKAWNLVWEREVPTWTHLIVAAPVASLRLPPSLLLKNVLPEA